MAMTIARSRMTQKGQVTLPAEMRANLLLHPRDEVEFELVDGAILVRPVRTSLMDFAGFVPSRARPLSDRELREAFEQGVADDEMAKMQLEVTDAR